MDFEMEGVRLRGRPKKTWSEVKEKIVRPDKYARKMLWTVGVGNFFFFSGMHY